MNALEERQNIQWNRALRPAGLALGVWLLLAAVLAGFDYSLTHALPSASMLVKRVGQLFSQCLVFFFGPLVLLLILFGVARRLWVVATVQGLRFGALAFGLIGLFWIGTATLAYIDGTDHWEALPWITPPYLDEFLARHSGFEAVTYQGTRALTLYDNKGHHAIVSGDDLIGATLVFEPCPSQLGPALFGGIPPFPGSKCTTRVRISNPRRAWTVYQFKPGEGGTHQALEDHFENWARGIGAESRVSGYRDYNFTAHLGERNWDLWWRYGRNLSTELYIPENGMTPPLPEAAEAEPQS